MPGVGTTHHVEIGGHYYLVRPGSYLKKAAPQFGARFTTGDPDFNNLSMWQHWAQRCFIGGVGQELWADDAMFDEGVGLDTSEHERVTLSRDLARGSGSNWSISASSTASTYGYKAITYNSKLYVYTIPASNVEGHLWEYDPSTDGWTRITALDAANIEGRSIAVFDGKLLIGGRDSATGTAKLVYASGSLASWSTASNPAGVTQAIYAMRAFQQKLYVAYGIQIWRLKDDGAWDGNTVFYKANSSSESNYIVAMEVHLGFLYMLSQNGHVHRTDGNTTFDIWNWDGQTQGKAIRSFDGRLFILTFEYTNTADVGFGVLYQMSGSAVTQLKRWGDSNSATHIPNMTVYDRRLWYGASNLLGFDGAGTRTGFGVACYDAIEDAHSIVATNSDTVTYPRGSTPYRDYIVDDVFFFGGYMFAFVRGHGAFKTPYGPRDRVSTVVAAKRYDLTAAGGSVASLNGGWLKTSAYDAGTPGVKKLWRKIVLDIAIPTGCSAVLDYSTNEGTSWTTAATLTTVAGRSRVETFLNNIVSTSLKLRITLRSTVATSSPVLYGYVVSYIPVPEPNWMWSMTLVLAEKPVLLDGTTDTVDTEAELDFLSTQWRAKQLVSFTDAEGDRWASNGSPGALIYDITFALRDLNQPLEGEVTITLLEAVETY